MRMKLIVAVAALGLAGAAAAQAPEAAGVIKARQAGMKAIGGAFKGMMDQTRGGSPDPAVMKRHAAALAQHSSKVSGWFGPGTATAAGTKTAALPAVWTQNAAFRKAAAEFDVQAKKTLALANAGDMQAIGPQVRALGATCKGCHDSYKAKDD